MRRPYKKPVTKVSPDIKAPEPRLSGFVVFLLKLLVKPYLFLFFGVAKVILRGDHLVEAFRRALAGESRCIVAFRHPNGGEPQILTWFFLFRLRAHAARMGVRFARRPHALFVYGYDVIRWGGWVARYVMPNVGAMPIYHTRMDTKGMARIHDTIINGPWPLAIAPEGQVSYTADTVPRLEQGIIRIGFQAVQKLAQTAEKENRAPPPVEILPVSIHFRFGVIGKASKERLVRKIEKYCGFSRENRTLPIEERLERCRNHILEANEERYGIKADTFLSFNERLEAVVYAALRTAERAMGLNDEGDFFTRLHKVRQICWDRIFLPGVDSLDGMSRVECGIRDLGAGEAWYAARHQELADFAWYFRGPIPTEEDSIHNKVEYVQNLWDFANRTMGGRQFNRKNILMRKVVIQSGPVVNLSQHLPAYRESRKATVATVMSDMEKAFHRCIEEANEAETG